MLTPSTISIPQNGSGTVYINTTVTEGATQELLLSVLNLPINVVALFDRQVLKSGRSTTLVLNVGNTPVDTYTLSVQAIGPVTQHTSTLILQVTPSDFSI